VKTVLIVARDNGYGLSLDAEILKGVLSTKGLIVANATPSGRSMWSGWFGKPSYDLIIHIERVFPRWMNASFCHWLVPNQERFPVRHLSRLRDVDLILAKTRHAEAIFNAKGARTIFSGFTGRDRFQPSVLKNWDAFFHLAGANTLKGTEAILEAWGDNPHWPDLTLVQKTKNVASTLPANVKLISGYLDDQELQRLQNECGIHLCPSQAEGWAHHLHEAMSCGSIVLTTDAPPMNEFISEGQGALVPFSAFEPRHLGIKYFVNQKELVRQIEHLISLQTEHKQSIGQAARLAFLEQYQLFPARFSAILDQELLASKAC
jgi:Glycosyl transferases group 1